MQKQLELEFKKHLYKSTLNQQIQVCFQFETLYKNIKKSQWYYHQTTKLLINSALDDHSNQQWYWRDRKFEMASNILENMHRLEIKTNSSLLYPFAVYYGELRQWQAILDRIPPLDHLLARPNLCAAFQLKDLEKAQELLDLKIQHKRKGYRTIIAGFLFLDQPQTALEYYHIMNAQFSPPLFVDELLLLKIYRRLDHPDLPGLESTLQHRLDPKVSLEQQIQASVLAEFKQRFETRRDPFLFNEHT